MTVLEFRNLVASKSSNRDQLTIPLEKLRHQINEALLEIATRITPQNLIVDKTFTGEVIRQIGQDTFIRKPKQITAETDEIDIDSTLLDALAYRVLAFNEVQRAQYYLGMFFGLLSNYDFNQIEYRLGIEEKENEIRSLF